MCPLYPFHLVLLYLCLLLPLLLAVVEGSEELFSNWKITFMPRTIKQLQEQNQTEVTLTCEGCYLPKDVRDGYPNLQMALVSDDPFVAGIEHEYDPAGGPGGQEATADGGDEGGMGRPTLVIDLRKARRVFRVSFNVSGKFLGRTKIRPVVTYGENGDIQANISSDDDDAVLPVSIIRKKDLKSKLFSYSVALLISIAYINMGCALDLQVVKETLRRPIGPAIGFVSQYIAMPLISFALGFLFFDSPAMRLGLFVTGTSPGGGASNIWTLMFGGNLNLSVTMTAISTFAAFFMMPLWIMTLGRVIFDETDIIIPYYKICTYAVCLVVPLAIGLLIARYLPRVSSFLVRILKPMALFLILFIVVFGVWANLYIFQLMTWRVLVTGMALPWLGFAFGCTFSRLCRRSIPDIIAIAIETGVQNTGVSIFILWFTLDHPDGDLAAVVPVAAATMTPLPLLVALCLMKIRECFFDKEGARKDGGGTTCQAVELATEDEFKQSESSQKLMENGGEKSNGRHCPLMG